MQRKRVWSESLYETVAFVKREVADAERDFNAKPESGRQVLFRQHFIVDRSFLNYVGIYTRPHADISLPESDRHHSAEESRYLLGGVWCYGTKSGVLMSSPQTT